MLHANVAATFRLRNLREIVINSSDNGKRRLKPAATCPTFVVRTGLVHEAFLRSTAFTIKKLDKHC